MIARGELDYGNRVKILALEPFMGGSHQAFWLGLQRASAHTVEILAMRPRNWKWRMRGAALWMARELAGRRDLPDVLVASDFVSLADLVALLPERWRRIPRAIYFHENQLTYPVPPGEKLDFHYGLTNFVSAMTARLLFFNSAYHLESFFEELPRFLRMLPDFRPLAAVDELRARAEVLPLGCDLRFFDAHGPRSGDGNMPRTILWNHRWEFDKQPEEFFEALFELKEFGHSFRVIVAGERASAWPTVFDEARRRLSEEIIVFGTLADRAEYARALWQADIAVSTAIHEFFGVATVEAIYCGCYPLLPARLAYPELIPAALADRHLYRGKESLVRRLRDLTSEPVLAADPSLRERVAAHDWSVLAPRYDEAFARLACLRDD